METGKKSETLTELFKQFPGIGQRQAQRFMRFIAQADTQYVTRLTKTITELRAASKQCPECFIRHEEQENLCPTCKKGDTNVLVIVEKDIDAHTLSNSISSTMHVRYFILGMLLQIVSNRGIEQTRIPTLITLLKEKGIEEVIIALSVHPDAEHTMYYLAEVIQKNYPNIKITTLGRGLSNGAELEYSDPGTLTNSLQRRNAVHDTKNKREGTE